MQLPSLRSLQTDCTKTVKRFPFEVFFASLGTVAGIVNFQVPYQDNLAQILIRLMMISLFGLTLMLSLTLCSETNHKSKFFICTGRILILGLLVGLYFILNPNLETTLWLRFLLFALSFHLLVSFIPFLGAGKLNGFWQYNKLLFLRFCTSVLYSGVLFAGISIAILSVNELFGLRLNGHIYGQLWFLIAGIFNTLFFLAGIPENLKDLTTKTEYPKSLKIFTQFVLIPLATIYLAILLTYELKIALEWELPKSSVAALILGYAVFGILSILLIYPIKEEQGNRWIYLFSKSVYLLMLPLIVLLVLSVWKRVSDYGITEERYFLIMLAFWLSFITGYFLLSRTDDIRIIPISLCFIALFSSYGPQSAFTISKKSQQARLEKIIKTKKGKEKSAEIQNVASYLIQKHGLESLQPFIKQNIDSIELVFNKKIKTNSTQQHVYSKYDANNDAKDSVIKLIDPSYNKFSPNNMNITYFTNEESGKISIEKPSLIIELNYINNNKELPKFKIGNTEVVLSTDKNSNLILKTNTKRMVYVPSKKLLKLLKEKALFSQDKTGRLIVPEKMMKELFRINGQPVWIWFDNLEGNFAKENEIKAEVSNFNGYLIIPQ